MSFLLSNSNPQSRVANAPIIAQIDPPTTGPAMLQYPIGTMWINTSTNVVFMLTSVTGGVAFWQETIAGAPGVFTDLTVTPGPINLTGTTHIVGDNNVANVILLEENGGAAATIKIESLQGTGSDSIEIISGAGGIEITTAAPAGDIAITSAAGSIPISSGENIPGAIELLVDGGAASTLILTNASGTGVDSVQLNSDLGGVEVLTAAAGKDIVLASNLGSISLASGENVANSIILESSGGVLSTVAISNIAGTNDASVAATASIHIVSDLGGIGIQSGIDLNVLVDTVATINTTNGDIQLIADAGDIVETATLGDVDITADAGDINIEATLGALNLTAGGGISWNVTGAIDLDATASSHFTVTGAAADLTLSSVGGSVNVLADQVAVDAVVVNASAGGFHIDGVLASHVTVTGAAADLTVSASGGSLNMTASEVAADAIVISATGASAGIQIAPAATVASVAIANIIPTVARTVSVSTGAIGSAIADTLNLGTGATAFAGATKVVNICTGANTLGASTVNIATGTTASGTKAVAIGNSTDALTAVTAFGVVGVNSLGTGATTIGSTATGGAVAINSASTITALGTVNINDSGTGATTIGSAATGGAIVATTNTSISLDSKTASHFLVTGAADLTLRSTAGSMVIQGGEAVSDSIQLNASAGGMTITTAAASDVVLTGGNLEVASATKGVILGSGTKVIDGAGSPNASVTAPKGSLYLATNGSGVADRLYINTDGATAWTAITTVS